MDPEEIDRFYTNLGERIKRARTRESRFSQETLGKMIGMSRPSVVNIEKGRQHLPLHTLVEIAQLLKVSITDLIPLQSSNLVKLPAEIKSKITTKELPSIANILELNNEDNGNEQNQRESRRVARRGKNK